MNSPNIDYLLKHYMIQDVLLYQQRLKSDVEKKQNDLKSLIGERYNELFRATESFGKMNNSINELILSLKSLNNVIIQNNNGAINHLDHDDVSTQNSNQENYYVWAIACKFLFDLPLQTWNFLYQENFVLATYSNFYGNHLSEYLSCQNSSLRNDFCCLQSKSIQNLTYYIIQKCWLKVHEHLARKDFDCLKFADTFSCLILLKSCPISEFLREFFSKQTKNIEDTLMGENEISSLTETIMNIICNIMECSSVFCGNSTNQSIFAQRFQYILDTNFFFEITYDHATNYAKQLPHHLTIFTLRNGLKNHDDFEKMKKENIIDRSKIDEWIQSIQERFSILIEEKFKLVPSIKKLYSEIITVEKKLIKKDLKLEDLNNWIWKKWFISAFETRVYKITEEKLQSIVETFKLLLPTFEKVLLNCDLNILEIVWKDSHGQKNEFISLIIKCCAMIDDELQSLYENVIIFKDDYHYLLEEIYQNIHQFLLSLKEHIDSFKSIKPFLLFGAILFQKLPELCPNLRLIFSIKNDQLIKSIDWNKIENQIKSISEAYMLDWFTMIINDHFSSIETSVFVELTKFLQNFSSWETVRLSNDKGEIISTIEVPNQLSLVTFELLQNICIDINRFCAHMVPRKVLIEILVMIGQNLLFLYGNSSKNLATDNVIPKSTKQIMSLQLYFDLFFIKKIFSNAKDDILRNKYLSNINELMTSLEANIDPFDMHLMHPYIEVNSEKLCKSYHITLGFLFFDRSHLTSTQPIQSSKELSGIAKQDIIHNLMLIHSWSDEFKTIKPNSNE